MEPGQRPNPAFKTKVFISVFIVAINLRSIETRMKEARKHVMLKIAEAATISETNPHVKYRLACQQLSHYEHLCTEYNAGGFGIDTRTNVRQKRDYWQAEVDRLLIEII